MAEQEQSRTEPATPFKLEEARKRGSVSKSFELSSLFAICVLLVVMYVWGEKMVGAQLKLDAAILSQAHLLNVEAGSVAYWFPMLLKMGFEALAPLLLPLMVIAILGSLVQTGPVFSFFPLKPQVERLSPIAGLKRLFSVRLLFELGKNIVKLVLATAVVCLFFGDLLPQLIGLLQSDPRGAVAFVLRHGARIVLYLAFILAVIAFIDAMFSSWHYMDQMKMSRRELREEVKRREGDPRIRARRRELQREMLRRARAIKSVPDADVLITNPTRLAVALSYRRTEMTAPKVIAKGAGELAVQMRAIARRHQVPALRDAQLAQALFRGVDLDKEVPERLFPQVARVLAWAYSLRPRAWQEEPAR
jgi:flagellar biosynthetic protein FlhB